MTREEAIKSLKNIVEYWTYKPTEVEAANMPIAALRPISREPAEKVWKGERNQDEHGRVVCSRCGSICAIGTKNALHNAKKYDRFCFFCGAPMTDEAVEMVMERLEEMKNG